MCIDLGKVEYDIHFRQCCRNTIQETHLVIGKERKNCISLNRVIIKDDFGWEKSLVVAKLDDVNEATFKQLIIDAATLISPSGFITNVPRSAKPSSSIITPKLRVMRPVGSPIIG